MEVRQASFYLYLETSLESCNSVELWPRCVVVPLFTIGNRFSCGCHLGYPQDWWRNGRGGQRQWWGECFLHPEWTAMRFMCHPICGPNLDLTAYLFIFWGLHVLYLHEPMYPMRCRTPLCPCSRWGNGGLRGERICPVSKTLRVAEL